MKNAALIALLAVAVGVGALGMACGGAPGTPSVPGGMDTSDAGGMSTASSTAMPTAPTSTDTSGGSSGGASDAGSH